ncbi:MAG: flavin oxidoreductase/NADH oxidase [Clostridia bacterium]|nr:flavin oxidoreductase/NADH oxidase [Clostridia bacterium]
MTRNVPLTPERFAEATQNCNVEIPYTSDISVLSEKTVIGSKTIENRLACQAMEGCDGNADGAPGELTERRYLRFAKGGAGIIWFEATACTEEGRANPRQLYLNRKNLDNFKSLVNKIRETAIRENGYAPLIIMQNTHSGRYSKPHGVAEPVIAYNNPLLEDSGPIEKSHIITDEGIDRIGEAMVNNSVLAEKAGFDGVDIKCCHRYLNSELLSAYNRGGRYGGCFENRTRLLRETVRNSMHAVSTDFIVSSRLNIYDGLPFPYGFGVSEKSGTDPDLDEPKRLVKELRGLGMQIINITMGNPYFNPHVNRPFSMGPYQADEHPVEGVARVLNGISEVHAAVPEIKVLASALSWLGVVSPNVAAAYIANGGFDFAGFGRMIFAYPDFAKDILTRGSLDSRKICIACSKCTEIMRTPGGTPGCAVRDPLYTEIYRKIKNSTK